MKRIKVLVSVLCFVFAGMAAVYGQSSEKVTFHGFGGWGYGKTDGARYLSGAKEGDYNHAQFFLNLNADLTEKLSIIAQYGFVQNHLGTKFAFDYAFAEWKFSDQLRFRIGKVKHAFGIYGEILDVGTLRPFLTLAQGIYGSHGYVGKGLNGVALTGSIHSKSGWGVAYDLYFGQLKTSAETPVILGFGVSHDPSTLNDSLVYYDKDIADLFGGRISVFPPIEGLNIGFSGYTGEDKGTEGFRGGFTGRQKAYGAFMEYLSTDLLVRSEFIKYFQNAKAGAENGNLDSITNSFYVELAYKFLKNFQAAFRFEQSRAEITGLDASLLPRFFQEYLKHQDITLGLNYWFSQNLVVKASYHMVKGINYAFPHFDDPIAFLMMGIFDNQTKLFQLGAQFSF